MMTAKPANSTNTPKIVKGKKGFESLEIVGLWEIFNSKLDKKIKS